MTTRRPGRRDPLEAAVEVALQPGRFMHFENAKRCYERSDLHREWAALVADVRRAHHRKTGFMAAFERLAAGHGPRDAPSFLDRARTRWSARAEP
jgi:hypothetical protein